MPDVTIPKLILFFAATGIFFYNFEHYAAASCEEMSINYGSSFVCSKSGKSSDTAKSEKTQKTVLRLFDMRAIFNEGDPIVFVGKLTNKTGTPISGAKITVLHDGTCQNKIIGEGITDKMGRFMVYSTAKVWDKKDNLIKTHAEFLGQDKFLSSKSEPTIVVVYPLQNKGC
jgi:hypothetical protein